MIRDLINRIKRIGQKKSAILMYHQICDRKSDPWQLAVSIENFELHLNVLKRKFNVVSMDELTFLHSRGRLNKNFVAITFDDGFADNYYNAIPLLEWYKLPATFYFATNPLQEARYYWWDELETILFQTLSLPIYLNIRIAEEVVEFHFRRHENLTPRASEEINKWVYGKTSANERIQLYLLLWRKIQPLHHDKQREIIEYLKGWAGDVTIKCPKGLIMRENQMKSIAQNSLFSIGAHTVNHSMLAAQPKHVQTFEILESKNSIERMLNKKISGFAYPYGNYNDVTRSLIEEAGFQYAVSTESKPIDVNSDRLSLPRMHIKNWKEQEFSTALEQMLK